MTWQPIDTAPRDGTAILAHQLGASPAVVRWQDYKGQGETCWRDAMGHKRQLLTHWHPLPEPPQ